MYSAQNVDEVLGAFGSSPKGLDDDKITSQRETHGFNELPKKKRSLLKLFLQQFRDIMVYILMVALVVSIVMPFIEGGSLNIESFLDAIIILAILVLNAVLGFGQEYKAEEAIAMLEKLTSPQARVRRNGQEIIIPSRELVPGDIVILEAGDRISADARLISVSHFQTNESSLTGESRVVDKCTDPMRDVNLPLAEKANMVFAGTLVTRGSSECVVTAVGVKTEIGKIAKLVSETKIPETPLQERMQKLGKILGGVVLLLCLVVIGVGFQHGMGFVEILLIGVSLAVSAVPEGLPAVVTVCMAMGVRRMVKHNALVRRLDALETLGSVNVICSDKTGTITENRMKVVQTWVVPGEDENLLVEIGASCNRAQLPNLGDPTEIGLLVCAKERNVERSKIDEEEVPFTSKEKYMQTRHGDRVFLKGAPEVIVELIGGDQSQEMIEKDHEMAKEGLRVLGCAIKEGDSARLVGLIAMEDPPRETAKQSIEEAKQAGIRTVMITGDNIETAKAIAADVGIEGGALFGKDLNSMSNQELRNQVQNVSVYARVSPEHKLRILDAFKKSGQIVAMTGDGVNDAPALKGAHVGIAMGKVGTQVAREASSVVLADDHYQTIVAAIREGRRIYDNIKKFVLFLLRANFDELLLITTTLFLRLPLPYLPIHILWINLMTDSLPALALGVEKAEPDIMKNPPRDPDEHILAGEWGRLVLSALLSFGVAFLYFLWRLSQGASIEHARAGLLTLAIVIELLMAISSRSRRSILKVGAFSNKWMLGAISIPFLLQLIILYTPLHVYFHIAPLSLIEWGHILILGASVFVIFEMIKLLPQKMTVRRT